MDRPSPGTSGVEPGETGNHFVIQGDFADQIRPQRNIDAQD